MGLIETSIDLSSDSPKAQSQFKHLLPIIKKQTQVFKFYSIFYQESFLKIRSLCSPLRLWEHFKQFKSLIDLFNIFLNKKNFQNSI
jgi:hypothetical protein